MAKDEWQGNYYLTESGAMATGELIMDDTRYIFSDSGELKEKKALNVGWVYRTDTVISLTIVKNRSELIVLRRLLMSVSIMAALVIGKRLSRKMGLTALLFAWDIVVVEDKELAYNIQEFNRLGNSLWCLSLYLCRK